MIIPFSFEPDIRNLSRFLTRDNESGYAFAVSANQALIPDINREIIQFASEENKNASLFSFDTSQLTNPVAQLRKMLEQSAADAVIITNLDLCIKASDQFLIALNFSREELYGLGKPFLFWISKDNLARMNQVAKDFFVQRRISTVWFDEIALEEPVELYLKKFDKAVIGTDDFKQLTRKKTLLQKQLAEAEKNKVPSGRIVQEIVAPLLKNYSETGLLDQALDLITTYKRALMKGRTEDLLLAGDICKQVGNINGALLFYEKCRTETEKKLIDNRESKPGEEDSGNQANPRNVGLLEGLAISFYKLAMIYKSMNDDIKGMEYFNEWKAIIASLKEKAPQVEKYGQWDQAEY